jgi:hypothetical protein
MSGRLSLGLVSIGDILSNKSTSAQAGGWRLAAEHLGHTHTFRFLLNSAQVPVTLALSVVDLEDLNVDVNVYVDVDESDLR